MGKFAFPGFDPLGFDTDANPTITSGDSASVVENVAAGTVIYTATADEAVTWTLEGADAAAFTIQASGQVSINASPDFETKSVYEFVVVATNAIPVDTRKTVTLNVTNIDDTAPTITSGPSVSTDEKLSASTVIYTATADEPVAWSLTGADAAALSIAASGQVTFNAVPFHHVKSSYSVVLNAVDGAGNSQTKALSITVNDLAPVITSGNNVSVDENIDPSTVIYTATADEPVTWSLGAGGADFTINSSGQVRFVASPDFETKSAYTLAIVASGVTTKTVGISIIDVDDTPPVITSADTFTVEENSTGTAYTATANEAVAWSLDGPEAGQFSIDAATGALSFNVPPDYELKTSYEIGIVATDPAGNSSVKVVTGTITNVLEFRISSPALVNVLENTSITTAVYIAVAQEAPGPVTWSLSGDDAADFILDPATGALRFFEAPDYELKTAYSITITASAAGETASIDLTVAITDVTEDAADPTTTFTAVAQNATPEQYIGWRVLRADGVQRTPVTDFLSAATGPTVTMTEPQFEAARGETEGVIVVATLMEDGTPVTNGGMLIEDRWPVNRVVSGADGTTQRQVWKRSETQPARPLGDGIPAGWSDVPLGGVNPLWVSVAEQTGEGELVTQWSIPALSGVYTVIFQWSVDGIDWHTDYQEGDLFFRSSGDNGETWDEAVRAVGEAGTGTQHVFKLVPDDAPVPATPTGNGIPVGWSDGPQAGDGDQYMSVSDQLPDGTLKPGASWSLPFRINGRDGISGEDSITALLTNELHSVPASSGGVVSNYSGANGSVLVFFGTEDASPFFNLSTASNPQGLVVEYSGNDYTITGAGAGTGQFGNSSVTSATLTITVQGTGIFSGVTLTKTFTLTKSLAGSTGTDAIGIYLISNRQTVAFDSTGNVIGAQDIVFQTQRMNNSFSVAWSMTTVQGVALSNSNFASTSSTGATVTDSTFKSICAANNTKGIIVTASILSGTYEDRISVVKVDDGAGGIYDADTTVTTPPTSSGLVSLSALTTLATCAIDDKKADGTFKAQWACVFETDPGGSSTMQLSVEHKRSTSSTWTAELFTNRTNFEGEGPEQINLIAIFSAPALAGNYDIRLRGNIAGLGSSVLDKSAFAVEWVPAG